MFGELAYIILVFQFIKTLANTTYRLPENNTKAPKNVGGIII